MNSLHSGQTLGPYRILNQIGQGGMATVYKAYHAATDRDVAVKVLPPQLAGDPEFLGRFQQEARTIARLEHPHILPVHDFGEEAGLTYLVMRYMEAGTLKERMQAGKLEPAEVDRLFTQLAEALSYAHAHGVIHRDLKPANVMVDAQGNVFLTDFGIAKLLESDAHFTATGAMVGTPAYMSPEQVLGQKVDQRSDLYSLGIILYQMVAGREPFEADTPMAVALKHVHAPLPLPTTFNPQIAPGLERLILKSLAKEPADRFATAADFLAAWKQAVKEAQEQRGAETTGGAGRTASAPAPARRGLPVWAWAGLALGTLGLCTLAVAGAAWLGSGLARGGAETATQAVLAGVSPTSVEDPTLAPTHRPEVRATVTSGAAAALPPALPTAPSVTPTASPLEALNVTNNPRESAEPHLLFDQTGTLHLVWYDASLRPTDASQAYELLHRQLSPNGEWSAASSLTGAFELLYRQSLALLMGPQGQACVFWEGAPAVNRPDKIGWYQSCQSETAWSEAQKLETAERATNDLVPALAPEGEWRKLYISFGTAFFEDIQLSDADRTAYAPQIAFDGHQGAYAVWAYMQPEAELDGCASSDGGQTWSQPERLSEAADAPNLSSYRNLALRADAAGGLHLVWTSSAGLLYRAWTAAAGWGPAQVLSAEMGGNPYLALDADGRAHVVWKSYGYTNGIQYFRQNAAGSWDDPRLIANDSGADMPVLGIAPDGQRHFVWTAPGAETRETDLYYARLP